jgi:hypothetical protein
MKYNSEKNSVVFRFANTFIFYFLFFIFYFFVSLYKRSVMGIGPAVAIPVAIQKAGLQIGDIDLFEINEAFASQYVYCAEKLNIPFDKVNVNGGAIALGI